jgi:pseudouridine-5'-phosphate glycosidase
MLRASNTALTNAFKSVQRCARKRHLTTSNRSQLIKNDFLVVGEEVKGSSAPLVALESTIITHGLPYPQNLETALQVEAEIRTSGALPATIGKLSFY